MWKVFVVLVLFSLQAFAGNVSSYSYASVNVTTAAYVTLIASTPTISHQFLVCDNSGHILKIASGAAGSEVDLFTCPINTCLMIQMDTSVKAGSRLSIRAIDASATTGYNTVSLIP